MPITASEIRRIESGLEPPAEMGKFTSQMAHEIRNPLNTIRMQAAVIRNKLVYPSPENLQVAKDQLERLDREVLRIEKLVKVFLEFSRPPNDESEDARLVEFIEKEA